MRSFNKSRVILFIFSLSLCLQIFSQQKAETDSTLEDIEALNEDAINLYNKGKYEEALPILKKAIKLHDSSAINDPILLFELYVNMFNISVENRLIDESLEYAEKAKTISEKHKIATADLVELYTALAYVEDAYNKNPKKALGYITFAHEILQKDRTELLKRNADKFISKSAIVLEWFVTLKMRLGNEEQLIKSYNQFKSFYLKHKNNLEVKKYFAQGNFKMGRFYQDTNAELASKYFDFAIKNGEKELKIYGNICSALGYLHVNQYEKIPPYIKALSKFEDLNRFQKLNILELECAYYSKIKNIGNLINSSNEALTLLNDNNTEVDVLNFNAKDFKPSKNYKYPVLLYQFAIPLQSTDDSRLMPTANEIYKICLSQFDERIGRTPIDNYAFFYSILRGKLFNHILKNTLSYEEKLDIVSKMERIETQSDFNTMLSNRNLSEQKTSLDSLFSKEISIREEITLLKQNNKIKDSITEQQIFELELDLEKLYSKIENAYPHIYDISTNKFSTSTLDIQDDHAIFRFYKGSDHSSYMTKAYKEDALETHLYRVKINNSSIEIDDLGDYESIESDVTSFLNVLKSPNQIDSINSQSTVLYERLFKNTSVPSNIVIISDNILRYLPFEVLKNKEDYLIEQSVISYASGLSYLSDVNSFNTEHTKSVSFFAPSYESSVLSDTQIAVRGDNYKLEGALEEVNILAELTNGEVFEKTNATKEMFMGLKNEYSIIHMAGHAFLNDTEPELSSLIFSDNLEDNELSISEIYGFKSNANLAVLSACNTGVGGFKSGKGVVSLSQAFMFSGIPSTLSSLWSAPDNSTKEIMISFYKHLADGKTKSQSLQLSKIEYLKGVSNDKLRHPYYWAGFVIYGDDSPIQFEQSVNYYLWVFVIIILSFFIVFKTKRKKPK